MTTKHQWPQVDSPSTSSAASSSSPSHRWQPPGHFGKDHTPPPFRRDLSLPTSSHRRMSRSFTKHSITCRRHVSPDEITRSAKQLHTPDQATPQQVCAQHDHEEYACMQDPPSRSLVSRMSTASRAYTGFNGYVRRVWYAVVHAADSWWSKLRAVLKGVFVESYCIHVRMCLLGNF